MSSITESEVEAAALECLGALGWNVAHGPVRRVLASTESGGRQGCKALGPKRSCAMSRSRFPANGPDSRPPADRL